MKSLFLTLLVILPVVWCGDWSVTVEDQCVFKGATALIKCSYDYPSGHLVTSTAWYKAQYVSGGRALVPVSSLNVAWDHFLSMGNYRGNCDLQIKDVRYADEGTYFFSFWTTINSWTSKSPFYLTVRELTAVVQPSTVTEGERVRLTCVSGCTNPVHMVWFRDGPPVPGSEFWAGRGDAGRYYCAVRGQETAISDTVTLSVQYAPDDVRLWSPKGDIIQGSSVTLVCMSNANPPVKHGGYSFYKDGKFISSGPRHKISNVQPGHRGWYHCQARNNVSRGGFHRFNSTQVHLDVQYPPWNISVSVTPQRMVEGSSVNLTCSSDANPAAHSYTWYRPTNSGSLLQAGSGPMLALPSVKAVDTGLYLCKAANRLGANDSTEVLLTLDTHQPGVQILPVLAGMGFSLLVILMVIALLMFWRKRRTAANKAQTLVDIRLTASVDPSDSLYGNVHVEPSSRPPCCPAQGKPHYQGDTELCRTPPLTAESRQSDLWTVSQALESNEDEVTYSTVTIKTLSVPPHSRSGAGGTSEVVYATVVQSS